MRRETRRARNLLVLAATLSLAACATSRAPARRFGPAAASDAAEGARAWGAAQERARSLGPSRLLYDARLGKGRAPAVPGTLAVTTDGESVRRASLTGPFGSNIAEYREGTIQGEDRRAFLVDPEALRSVLAGVWTGAPRIEGRDGGDLLLRWSGPIEAEGVLDLAGQRLRSLALHGSEGRLSIVYSGDARPWPEEIALKDERSGRSLSLRLVAVDPVSPP